MVRWDTTENEVSRHIVTAVEALVWQLAEVNSKIERENPMPVQGSGRTNAPAQQFHVNRRAQWVGHFLLDVVVA
ncbi:MAG: hypothetical protein AAF653_06245 [Chloroflexota bacterium]